MNEVVTSKTEPGKKLSVGLQSRLLYLLLKCPMLQNRGQGCACGEQDDIEAEAIAADDFAGCTAPEAADSMPTMRRWFCR